MSTSKRGKKQSKVTCRHRLKMPGSTAVSVLVACLWICGCGPKAVTSPTWILGSPARYPPSLFIIGVGSAPASGEPSETLKAAGASARAEIAQTLEVQIEHAAEYTVDTVSERSYGDGPTASVAEGGSWAMEVERSSLTTYSRTSTYQIVEGIELKEKFKDDASATLYVLAVLDKAEAGQRLRRQLNGLTEDVGEFERRAEAGRDDGDLLGAMNGYRQALNSSLRADIIRRQLGVVAPHSLWDSASNHSVRLATRLSALLGEFQFFVDVDETEIEDSIHEVLAATEFNVSTAGTAVGLTLWGRLSTKWDTYPILSGGPADGGDDLLVCRMYLGLKLVDNATNRIIGQVSFLANSNAGVRDTARQRTLRLMREQINEKLPAEIYRAMSMEIP